MEEQEAKTKSRQELYERRAGEDNYPDELRSAFEMFSQVGEFEPGELVRWKPGMRNRRRPAYGTPAVVVLKLAEAVAPDLAEPASAYFAEPLDLVLGLLDEEGDFITFYFDSRRFERWESVVEATGR